MTFPGNLSADEAHLAGIPSSLERRAIEQAEDAYYEAANYRQSFEQRLRDALPLGFDFSIVLDFVNWQARELLARDRLIRMGGSSANAANG